MRGDNVNFEGKVNRVDLKRYRLFLEGLTREKVDGTNIFVSVHPSKVMITKLKLNDKWRREIIERKKELELPKEEQIVKKVIEKPPKKIVKAKKGKAVKKKAAASQKPGKRSPKTAKKKEEIAAKKEKKLKTTKKPKTNRKTASKAGEI
jgi:hypothetical protein